MFIRSWHGCLLRRVAEDLVVFVFSWRIPGLRECDLWDEGVSVHECEHGCLACDDVNAALLTSGMHAVQAYTGFARLVLSSGDEDVWNGV